MNKRINTYLFLIFFLSNLGVQKRSIFLIKTNIFGTINEMRKPITPRNHLFKMLARREHSILEIREKLQKKYPEEGDEIEKIIKEFLKENWISEERYCEAFIRNQILKKTGPQKITQKLLQKGIEMELIDKKLEEIFPIHQQLDFILELANQKYENLKNRKKEETEFQLQQKVLKFLISRGFDFDMARKVAKNKANE